jgi:cell division protein FtsI/penicillin-binding protein 2
VGLEKADVTPLHAALLAAVVASEGRLAEPRVLLGDGGILGSPGDRGSPADDAREVLSPAVARRLRRAMEAVALEGTGGGLAPEGLRVAMKTGTAAEPGRGYHVNYVGMAPLPDPAVAFCVRVTNERTSPAVTRAAREVTRRLLHGLAERPGALRRAVQPSSRTWTETARP